MRHRGPDGSGQFVSADGRVRMAHARLAILDVSAAATQPMRSEDGRFAIVFNGECYGFQRLRERLASAGERFRTTSDTEVVLRWLMRHGRRGLADLDGMYALALHDAAAGTVLLARDAFGIKPLYVARLGRGLAFASEVRALLAAQVVPRRVDPLGLAGYLSYGVVPEPSTIVQGVEMLAPGSWLEWSVADGSVATGRGGSPLGGTPTGRVQPDELREAFLRAVQRHLVSDVPIGAFLSGGVDSSAIVAAMAQVAGTDIRTLTVSVPDVPALDEADLARAWAARWHARHHEVRLSASDLLRDLHGALAAQDQPTFDGINTYIVSRAARAAGLTVALSGLGGDELFGGYAPTRDVPRALRLRRRLGPLARPLGRALGALTPAWSRSASKRADLLTAAPAVGELYAARRRIFSPSQVARLWPSAPGAPLPLGLEEAGLASLEPRDAVCRMEASFYMRSQLLRDSDVMGMAASLEIRVPFLDLEFAGLAWNAGAEWRDGKRRFVQALGGLLDPEIQSRPKRGFTLPFEAWMQGPLRTEVESGLAALPAPLSAAAAMDLWRRFLSSPTKTGWTRPWALFVVSAYLGRHGLLV